MRAPLPHAAAIAGFGFSDPAKDLVKMIDFIEAFEHGHAFGALDAMQASVVVPPLHDRGAKLRRQHVLKKRNVLLHQLLLQVFGPGRDDYARAAAARRSDCRHQIRERLAGAGAGLDDEMTLLLKRTQHGFGHLNLAGAMFVLGVGFGN